MNYNPKITLVRVDAKQATNKVSESPLHKLLEKIRKNVDNPDLHTLRTNVRFNRPYIPRSYERLHRIYPTVRLKKTEDGQLYPSDYNDLLLLSAGPIFEEEKLEKVKQQTKVFPSTLAAFVGAGGRSVKILVRITLPDSQRRHNEVEMEHFFRKAYEMASSLYTSLLQVAVVPAGIHDGSSPVMASCRLTADEAPLLVEQVVPLRIDGSEPIAVTAIPPSSTAPDSPAGYSNKVRALVDFLNQRYDFRYNSIRGTTEYLDKRKAYWGWRMTDLRFINALSLDAREAGIEATPKEVMTYLNSSRIPTVDPVDRYIVEVMGQWDGHDYIGDLADCVRTDLPQWKAWFRLWFIGMVAQWMGYNRRYGNSIAPLLVSPQGWHKSTFCSQLLPPELRWGYIDSLKMDNQRLVMQSMCEFLLINIDEFNSISKKTQEGFLKNTMQLATISLKRPYARGIVQERRMASFIATSNLTDILSDPSGSRRFFVVDITEPIRMESPIPYTQLYAQAVAAVRNNERRWFDDKDLEAVMSHNRRYALLSSADMYFHNYFEAALPDDPDAMWMTATDIYDYIRHRAGATAVTESLAAFSRYLSNVPGMEKTHTRSGNVYRVKYVSKT